MEVHVTVSYYDCFVEQAGRRVSLIDEIVQPLVLESVPRNRWFSTDKDGKRVSEEGK